MKGDPAANGQDVFTDRRVSDLLPAEIVRQIGLDPDLLLFSRPFTGPRRMTDSILFSATPDPTTSPRRATMIDRYMVQPPAPVVGTPSWYIVEIAGTKVNAFCTFQISAGASDGVVVRDGQYLRFGHVLEQIRAPRTDFLGPQIVAIDRECQLGDYINGQTEIAAALIPSFMQRAECDAGFISVETVSYQARALFRVRVRDANAANIDKVVRLLIQAFAIAVEVYDG